MKKLTVKKLLNCVAFGISGLFSPYIVVPIFIIPVVYKYAENINQFLPWMLTFSVFAVILPGFYILWLLEAKNISDIHMSNLNDRKVPLLVAAVSSVIGAFLLYFLHAARPIFVISVVYAVNSLFLALVTQKWKISMHTGTFASIVIIAVVIFGMQCAWLALLLIPLAWSRVYRKRHTFWQVTAGAVVASLLTLMTLWVFGYI